MDVLGRSLSDAAQTYYSKITAELKYPVQIESLNREAHPGTEGYSQFNDNLHKIYLDQSLSNEVFETTLLKELLHCKHQEVSAPWVRPAVEDQRLLFYATNINSLVADIYIEKQLSEIGMHSEEKDLSRLNELVLMRDDEYLPHMRDTYVHLCATLFTMIFFTCADRERYEEVVQLFEDDQEVIKLTETLIDIIKTHGYSTPREQMRSIRRIAVCFGLKGKLLLVYNGTEAMI